MLVIPKEHHPTWPPLAAAGDGLLAEVAAQAHQVAVAEGIADTGYRVVFNTGAEAGQTVCPRARPCARRQADDLAAGLDGDTRGSRCTDEALPDG